VHVEIAGSGAPLLALHGWGLNLRVFDTLAPALTDFTLVRVDLPGHGRSPWDARAADLPGQAQLVRETVREHVASCAVVGWSLGAQIALELAALDAGFVQRLVLVAPTAKFVADPDWPHGMMPSTLARFESSLERDWRGTVSDFLELQVRGSSDAERVARALRDALLDHGEATPPALAAGLSMLRHSDLRATLKGVGQPALVVAGQYDRITLPAAAQAVAQHLPDARYVEIRRAGHAPFLSHTAQFAAVVREFLR
jgi:pimeloyl-[acyl-carrier protein] methyl ester esterase